VSISSRGRLRIAASVLAAVAAIGGILLLIYTPHTSAQQSEKCRTAHDLMDYTRAQVSSLNDWLTSGSSRPRVEAYQRWADRVQQYATQLEGPYRSWAYLLERGSREIVYLSEYVQSDPAPFSDKNPPPLWMKRYNDIREQFELAFAVFESDCPA
jgi:hypothetical protein